MDKFIFLDIDGVLIPNDRIMIDYAFNKRCQQNFGRIMKATGAKIVISSSWRKENLLDTIIILKECGFEYADDVVGITVRAHEHLKKGIHMKIPRGVEIKQWLDTNVHSKNGKNYNKKRLNKDFTYAILDDRDNMLLEHKDQFVHIYGNMGITNYDVMKTIEILNKENID